MVLAHKSSAFVRHSRFFFTFSSWYKFGGWWYCHLKFTRFCVCIYVLRANLLSWSCDCFCCCGGSWLQQPNINSVSALIIVAWNRATFWSAKRCWASKIVWNGCVCVCTMLSRRLHWCDVSSKLGSSCTNTNSSTDDWIKRQICRAAPVKHSENMAQQHYPTSRQTASVIAPLIWHIVIIIFRCIFYMHFNEERFSDCTNKNTWLLLSSLQQQQRQLLQDIYSCSLDST